MFLVLGVVAVGVIAVLIIGITNLLGRMPTADPEPDTAPPVACSDCITDDEAKTLVPSDATLEAVGLQLVEDYVFVKPWTAGGTADASKQQYDDGLGTPEQCWPMLDYSPVSATDPSETTNRGDRILDLGTYGDENGSISQMVRVFASAEAGAAYPRTLESTITGCPRYAISFDESRWDTEVHPTTIDSVAIVGDTGATLVGWEEQDGDWAVTIVDLQVSNIAIRTIYNHPVGAGPSNEQFAAFLTSTAAAMAALK